MDANGYKSLVVLLLVLFVSANSFSQTATPPSGSGTSGSPYQIDSLANLYWRTQCSSFLGDQRPPREH